MITEVVMKRELFGREISQRSQTEFFSATDLVRAGNAWRRSVDMQDFDMHDWFSLKGTKEFIESLEKKFGKVKISGKGRGQHTWVHPYLFIDMALAISPELKIEVYSWITDFLLKYRNESGDSYKKMAGAIFNKIDNKSKFSLYISDVADNIREKIGVENWQVATEDQLETRNKIHEAISLYCDILPVNEAVRLGIHNVLTAKK